LRDTARIRVLCVKSRSVLAIILYKTLLKPLIKTYSWDIC